MRIVLVLTGFAIVFLQACTPQSNKKVEKHDKLLVKQLAEDDMFTFVKVNAFLEGLDEKTNSEDLFVRAIDNYRNKKELDSAYFLLKQSILRKPSTNAYYELGNVLMDKKEYANAILAYQMSERMGYEPFSKVLYNISCAYSLSNKLELSGDYLQYAIQAGYANFDAIQKDPDLANLRNEPELFSSRYEAAIRGTSNAENLFFLQFKRQFSQVNLPFSLSNKVDLLLINQSTQISYDFEKYISEMRDAQFARDVSKGFYYLAKLKETENYVALVYVVKDLYFDEEAPLLFRLVTFTPAGKLIDKMEVAGRTYLGDELLETEFDKKLNFTLKKFETTYKKNPDEEGYKNNPIVKKTKVAEIKYHIDNAGHFVKDSGGEELTAAN